MKSQGKRIKIVKKITRFHSFNIKSSMLIFKDMIKIS